MTRSPRTTELGVAMVAAMTLVVLVIGIVSTGAVILKAHRSQTGLAFARNSQALQIARSGLTEARNWLNLRTSQPVLTFAPQLDPAVTPPILETIEPDIGLVREFRVSGRTWARYEVWKEWDADPDSIRLARRQTLQCEDVWQLRSASGPGATWRLRAMGYIYQRHDASVAFDQQPNHVVAKDFIQVEVSRLMLNLPGQAAINIGDGNECHINTNGRVIGGGTAGGIYYPAGTGTPTTGPGGSRVTGTPPLAATTQPYDDSIEYVFSMPLAQLKAMAFMNLTDISSFPNPVPDGSLIVVEQASIQFDNTIPLKGNGIIVLIGNVTISPGSNSNFSGLVYVAGSLTMRAPAEIRGAVVCTANMTLQGIGDYATIAYDEDVLNALRKSYGSYNYSTAFLRPWPEDR